MRTASVAVVQCATETTGRDSVAGTVGAMKIGVRALCGELAITVEHMTWMPETAESQW